MSSYDKAMEKSKKHVHMKGKDEKCKTCGKVMNESTEEGRDLDEKGKRPKPKFGAKNNDSEQD